MVHWSKIVVKIYPLIIIKTFAEKKEYDDKHFFKNGTLSSLVPVEPEEPVTLLPPLQAIYNVKERM